MNAINAKPGSKGYKILFESNTVIMNKKFAAAAANYGTPENTLIKNIRNDFPGMKEVVVSGHEQKKAHANTRFTYKNMEQYISAYDNSEELLKMFARVKKLSTPLASPYKYVSDWFVAQFPDYKKTPIIKDGKLVILPINEPDICQYKKKNDTSNDLKAS